MGPGTKRAPRLGGSVKIGIVPRRRPRKPRSKGRDQNREFFPLSLSLFPWRTFLSACAGTALRTIWIYFIAVDLFHPPLCNASRMLMKHAKRVRVSILLASVARISIALCVSYVFPSTEFCRAKLIWNMRTAVSKKVSSRDPFGWSRFLASVIRINRWASRY